MAASERLAVISAIADVITEIDEKLFDGDLDNKQWGELYRLRRKLWESHQLILNAALVDQIKVSTGRTATLRRISAQLEADHADLSGIADKIKKVASAIDSLVEMTAKAAKVAAALA